MAGEPRKVRRRSKSEIYLHFVWATWQRTPWFEGDIERRIHRSLQAEACSLRCDVLALNGMPDHVHALLKAPPTVAAATIAKQMKGNSSLFANAELLDHSFKWQENYGVFSVSASHRARVLDYIHNQKQHHAEQTLWLKAEETDEEEDW